MNRTEWAIIIAALSATIAGVVVLFIERVAR